MKIIATAFLLAILAASAGPALADDDDDDDDDRPRTGRIARGAGFEGISQARAVAIARANGLVQVEEVEFDDGKWEIEGRDGRGREIEIEVHGRTGRVLEIERD